MVEKNLIRPKDHFWSNLSLLGQLDDCKYGSLHSTFLHHKPTSNCIYQLHFFRRTFTTFKTYDYYIMRQQGSILPEGSSCDLSDSQLPFIKKNHTCLIINSQVEVFAQFQEARSLLHKLFHRGFIYVFSRGDTGFHMRQKPSWTELFYIKKTFPLDV